MEEEDDFDDPMTPISVKGRNKNRAICVSNEILC